MDLAVRRRDRAVGCDERRGVVGPPGIGARLGCAADEDPRVAPTGDLAERVGVRPGDRPGGGPEAIVVAAVLEVLGESDQAGAVCGRGVGELRCARYIRRDVVGRVGLD